MAPADIPISRSELLALVADLLDAYEVLEASSGSLASSSQRLLDWTTELLDRAVENDGWLSRVDAFEVASTILDHAYLPVHENTLLQTLALDLLAHYDLLMGRIDSWP